MREKSYGIWASIIMVSLGIILSALFYVSPPSRYNDYIVMIFGGVAASSLATLTIYTFEYRSVRRSTLENYYIAEFDILKSIYNIKYFNLEIPHKLFINYNRYDISFSSKDSKKKTTLDIFNHLNNNSVSDLSYINDEDYEHIENEVEKAIEYQKKQLDNFLKNYFNIFENLDYQACNNAYGNIYYFSKKGKRFNQNLYSKIYEPIYSEFTKLKSYYNQLRNLSVYNRHEIFYIVPIVNEIYSEVFEYEVEEDLGNPYRSTYVYNKIYRKTAQILENFRAAIYYCTPQKVEDEPVYVSLINKDM